MATNLYKFFDDIVCINLDISVDRKKHAEFYFDKLNIPARFLTVKKHKNGGMYGCFDSHIQILLDAYNKGHEYILVFEDDFLPTESYSEELVEKSIEFMKTNNDWDIFHLGYSCAKDTKEGISTIFSGIKYDDNIVQFNPFCTQALCYNKKSIKKIVESYKEYIGIVHYDMYISTYIDLKNYCIIPMLFDQNFYFEHNNNSADYIEVLIRSIFPFFAYTKFNYRLSLLKYRLKDLNFMVISKWIILTTFSIILYFIKLNLVVMNNNVIKNFMSYM